MLQRLRTSEAQRERHGSRDVLALVNMAPIVGVRHRTCQWIVQTGRPPLFCAAPSLPGRSWCADHLCIVIAPPDGAGG